MTIVPIIMSFLEQIQNDIASFSSKDKITLSEGYLKVLHRDMKI